jgi:hypothetical protein
VFTFHGGVIAETNEWFLHFFKCRKSSSIFCKEAKESGGFILSVDFSKAQKVYVTTERMWMCF